MAFRLVYLTDMNRPQDPCAVARRLPPGSWVVLRCFAPQAGRPELFSRLRRICRERRLRFIVSTYLELAVKLGADGLHLPERVASSGQLCKERLWLRLAGRSLSIAAHSPRALALANRLSPDQILLSPVFVTQSHRERQQLGSLTFARWQSLFPHLCVLPLGGVNRQSLRCLSSAKPKGAAFSSAWN
jgi:thiamine-phosphate pyrophosphorylase